MKQIILDILEESLAVKDRFIRSHIDLILRTADMLAVCIASGHKIVIFGNGGSAADAQHIAAEFVNRFQVERSPLAALAITTDSSVITSIANDYHFDDIFSKQIQALGKIDDAAVGISTSGNSPNVVKAISTAKAMGMHTIAMTGPGGRLAHLADLSFQVDSKVTARVQETHITVGHILCDLVERTLFPEKFVNNPATNP